MAHSATRHLVSCAAIFAVLPGCYLSHGLHDGADAGVQLDAQIDGDAGWIGSSDAVPPSSDAGMGPDTRVPVTVACRGSIAVPSPRDVVPCEREGAGDDDGDGFANPIDCNDCFAQINGGAFDIPGNGLDEDCSGSDDRGTTDLAAALESTAAGDAACALGVCRVRDGQSWGLVSARWTTGDGRGPLPDANMHRIVDRFGTYRPTDGARMLALSSGAAYDGDEFGGSVQHLFEPRPYPPGFPLVSPACPGVDSGPPFDSVALELVVRVPTNAIGLHFTSNFMTREYPAYLCSVYNDVYAVFLDDGAGLRNIVFDRDGNPVTVNNALLRTCEEDGPIVCELGSRPLVGALSASDSIVGLGGGTDCISTVTEVRGGSEITLRFAIWDSGDSVLDSVVLLDSLGWILAPFG